MGAHPGDPSTVVGADGVERSLLDLLAADPDGQLGARGADRWGSRLPFLLKVLAAEEPLSLQAHPSAEQAAEGFAAEEAAGVPRDAAIRNYKDPTAKPELICALTEFHALAGFRDPPRTVALLRALDAPDFAAVRRAAGRAAGRERAARAVHHADHAAADRRWTRCCRRCSTRACCTSRSTASSTWSAARSWSWARRYPGDAGVLAALLLNRLVLQPGEAIYLPAGNLHAYLHGTGVEILANSDNVLRCGLTPKHVDVPELLRVLDFALRRHAGAARRARSRPAVACTGRPRRSSSCPGSTGRPARRGPGRPPAGPQILVCTAGAVVADDARGEPAGAASAASPVWLPASATRRWSCDRRMRVRTRAAFPRPPPAV